MTRLSIAVPAAAAVLVLLVSAVPAVGGPAGASPAAPEATGDAAASAPPAVLPTAAPEGSGGPNVAAAMASGALSAAEAAAQVTAVLSHLGFGPEQDLGNDRILLHRCPFADIARESRAVVCGIHLGMLTATAERLNSPLRIAGLDPFVSDDPPICVVRLATPRSRRRRPGSEEAAP